MRRLSGYPEWFYQVTITMLAGLLMSAVLLIPNTLEMRLDVDVPIHVTGNYRLFGAVVHSLTGFLSMGLLGALIPLHIRLGWRRRINRFSGCTLLIIFALLLFSAIGIYYIGNPDLSRFVSLFHTLVGLTLILFFIWHSVQGQRIRAQARHQVGISQP